MSSVHYLRPDVIAEPLVSQWYAWAFLISPATAARYLTHSQMLVLKSFIDAPDVHVKAVQNPELVGGPFIQQPTSRVDEVRQLLDRSETEKAPLIELSQAIEQLDQLLANHQAGTSLAELYDKIPAPLQGYVELVFDANHHASVRYLEALLYRSEYYQPQQQSIGLRLLPDCDKRAFVLSTPRLHGDVEVLLNLPFNTPLLDDLFRARFHPIDLDALIQTLKQDHSVSLESESAFRSLFTTTRPPHSEPYQGDGLRVRYMGHACVLLETATTSILVDPLIAYHHPQGMTRFSYQDLPEKIDYVIITHNHQDHVMLETLFQIRHKIGQILIPGGHRGSLIDPSLRLCLQQIGFDNVREVDHLDEIPFAEGHICSFPFLGEHGDLDIATKAAWRIEAHGRSVLCVADSDNLDNILYQHIAQLFGPVDVLFIGMECEGAPYTWAYGPLLSQPVSRQQSASRRLNGSDSVRGLRLIEQLQPEQVYVYAMGMEPWLNYITSIHYSDDSMAIIESNKLIEACRQQGRIAERFLGRAEIELLPSQRSVHVPGLLPARKNRDVDASHKTSTNVSNSVSKNGTTPQSTAHDETQSGKLTEGPVATKAITDDLSTLLDDLFNAGISLMVNLGKLKVNGPKGSLTPELTARIKQHKAELMALLNGSTDHGSSEHGSSEQKEAEQVSTESDAREKERVSSLPQDAVLPDHIVPVPLTGDHAEQHILLTGATGFVGAFLLRELLQQTDATLHCLVRVPDKNQPSPDNAALSRIETALASYGLWHDDFRHRIITLVGDLSLPRFGLSVDQWQSLSEQVDVIYHNGATVHHLLPYEQLRAANVAGTVEALQLTTFGKPKRFHFLSTLSVLPAPEAAQGKQFEENAALAYDPIPNGGYNRSKWMAEQQVRQAMQRGLQGTIHRPGPASGSSDSGAFNRNDFLYRLMQGYIVSGKAPRGQLTLDLLPVDYLARAIVYLSRLPAARGGSYQHLHPHPVSSDLLLQACRETGIPLQQVSYQEWFSDLQQIARSQPDHPLYPLVALFASRAQSSQPLDESAGQAESAAEKALPYQTNISQGFLAQAPFELPALDLTLFTTYLRAMQQTGILEAHAS